MRTGCGKFYKWEIALIVSLAAFLLGSQRNMIGVLVGDIQRDLAISDSLMGLVPSVFSFGVALMIPLGGVFGDRFNRKRIIAAMVLLGSAATALCGLANGFAALVLFYSIPAAITGSVLAPSAYSLVTAYHERTRTAAMSIYMAVYNVSLVMGLAAAGLTRFMGWRGVFAVFGLAGFAVAALVIARVREPERRAAETRAADGGGEISALAALGLMLRTPSCIAAIIGFASIMCANNICFFWLPKYLQTADGPFGFAAAESCLGMVWIVIPSIVATLGVGAVTDALLPRFPRARVAMQTVAMLAGAPLLVMMGRTGSAAVLWTLCAVYGVTRGFYDVNTHVSLYDFVPVKMRARASGYMMMIAYLTGGLAGTWIVGAVMERLGTVAGMRAGFAFMAGLSALAGVALMFTMVFNFKKDRKNGLQ